MFLALDMDGVICAFNQAVKNLGDNYAAGLSDEAPQEDKQAMYDAIEKAGEKFWSQMPFMPDGKALWNFLKKYKPVILSSPGKFKYAPSGKALWVKKNIPGTPLFLSDTKSEYVDPYNLSILIDDSEKNINAWKHCGGKGILHTSAEDTEKKFLELMWEVPDIDMRQYLT